MFHYIADIFFMSATQMVICYSAHAPYELKSIMSVYFDIDLFITQ